MQLPFRRLFPEHDLIVHHQIRRMPDAELLHKVGVLLQLGQFVVARSESEVDRCIEMQERRIAPISRVQTVDTERGPLDRLFGLANVTVTTASSAGAVRIVALDSDVADRVVAQLTDIAAIGGEDAT